MARTVLKIDGMMCEACVSHVTKALAKVPGVENADVNLEQGQATVQHEDADQKALLDAVDDAGYQAEVVKT